MRVAWGHMADLQRSPTRMPRRQREQRAYALALTGGGASLVAVVGVILAVLGVIGWGIPMLAIIVAAVAGLLFKKTVSP